MLSLTLTTIALLCAAVKTIRRNLTVMLKIWTYRPVVDIFVTNTVFIKKTFDRNASRVIVKRFVLEEHVCLKI